MGTKNWTDEQKNAVARAILDNDYDEMRRLKADGKWITDNSTNPPRKMASETLSTLIATEIQSQRDNTPADSDDLQRTYTRGRIAGLTWVLQVIAELERAQ